MADNYTSIEEREALKHWGCLTLTDKQLKRVLKEHGVSYKTVDGFVYAWDDWVTRDGKEGGIMFGGSKWVKVSGWGTIKVREWLGY